MGVEEQPDAERYRTHLVARIGLNEMNLAHGSGVIVLVREPDREVIEQRDCEPWPAWSLDLPVCHGTPREAALIAVAASAEEGLLTPDGVESEGLLTAAEFMAVSDLVWARRRDAREEVRRANEADDAANPSEILRVARELRLAPEPGGTPGIWLVGCPTRGHGMELQVSTELFRCGYCRVGGGVEEFRSLVTARRAQAAGSAG